MGTGLRTATIGGVAAPPYTNGPYTWTLSSAAANTKMLNLQFTVSATSGDNRALYNRLYLTGTGTGGESLRSFTTVNDVRAGTVHGAHISLSWGDTGSASGLACGLRTTLHIANQAYTGLSGTFAGLMVETYCDGATSDPVGLTELAFIRINNGGNATGAADVDDDAYLLSLQGFTVGSGNVVAAKSSAAVSHTARIKVGSTDYWVMLSDAQ